MPFDRLRVRPAAGGYAIASLETQAVYSALIFNFVEGKPIHVVCSYDESTDTGYVVTAYIPDQNIWSNDFRTRRQRL